MALNLYDPRVLAEVVRQLPPVSTFFRDTFFGYHRPEVTEKIDVDLYKGTRRVAPFVSAKSSGKAVERIGFGTKTYTAPLIKEIDVTTVPDIQIRALGETLYSGANPSDRAVMLLTESLARFNESVSRREELMAASVFINGKLDIIGEGVKDSIDYGLTNKSTLTVANKDAWNYTGTGTISNPLADLKKWSNLCMQKGYRTPNIVIMDPEAASAFMSHPKVTAALSLWHMTNLTIEPKYQSENVRYLGTLRELNLEIYEYIEYYIDDWTNPLVPTEKSVMPSGTVIMASSNAKCTMYYGAMTYANEQTKTIETVVGERFSNAWTDNDPPVRFLRLQSRPLPVAHEVDSWYSATVTDNS